MSRKELTRSNDNVRIAGVIGGIGEYFGWSSDIITFIRILYAILAFTSWGALIIVYFVAAWVMPKKPKNDRNNQSRTWQNSDKGYYKDGRKIKDAEPINEDKNWSDF